ncbi:MAG: VOC family protein [Gaiellaceae bacterium]
MLRFGYTAAYVPDVEATLVFYERAFGLERRFVTPGGSYGELETGETALAFAALTLGQAQFPGGIRPIALDEAPPALEIALVSDDVATAFARAVEAGATPLTEPAEKPWGQTVAFVRDLNGLLIELCTPI